MPRLEACTDAVEENEPLPEQRRVSTTAMGTNCEPAAGFFRVVVCSRHLPHKLIYRVHLPQQVGSGQAPGLEMYAQMSGL